MDTDLVGIPCTVRFEDDSAVTGWLYGVLPRGVLISLDKDGDDIQFIPKQYTSWSRGEGPRATFAPDMGEVQRQLYELDGAVSEDMTRALRRINFGALMRSASKARTLERAISNARHDYHGHPESYDGQADLLLPLTLSRIPEVVDLHTEVYEEMEYSGLSEVIEKNYRAVVSIEARFIMPALDYRSGDPIEGMTQRAESWSRHAHRSLLEGAERLRETILARGLGSRRGAKPTSEDHAAGTLWRYAGASLRVLAGTGLAVGNTGIALTVGLASTLVTIGATAVPTYVGVLGSISAGLAQAADGLEKIGALQT